MMHASNSSITAMPFFADGKDVPTASSKKRYRQDPWDRPIAAAAAGAGEEKDEVAETLEGTEDYSEGTTTVDTLISLSTPTSATAQVEDPRSFRQLSH